MLNYSAIYERDYIAGRYREIRANCWSCAIFRRRCSVEGCSRIFRLLGYSDDWLATEFPVRGYQGGTKLPTTRADAVYFDNADWVSHRSASDTDWVQEHALILVEIKKPTENSDPSGQAEYYARWLQTPYVISTNGSELIIRLLERYSSLKELLRVKREELISRWAEIETILSRPRVEEFVRDSKPEIDNARDLSYVYYLDSLNKKLNDYLQSPISRFLESSDRIYTLDFHLSTEDAEQGCVRAEEILSSDMPNVIIGEPGSGKTYLLKYLAKKLTDAKFANEFLEVPVIIEAKYWGFRFETIIDAIYDELDSFLKGFTKTIARSELSLKKFTILIDGYDEIRNSKPAFLREIELLARSGKAKIILTSREANYHGELSAQFHAWRIEGISNEQIDDFAKKVASINNFSYILSEHNLLELARLPLYLIMLCRLGIDNESQIPNNKAKIQEEFARFLLHTYPHGRNPLFNPAFTLNQKLDFLSVLAKRKAIDVGFSDYVDCAHEIGLIGDSKLLLNEIIESGLLKGDLSRFDFIHPTIMEFFHARAIAVSTPDKIIEFIKEKHLQEEYFETVLFLVGQLRDQGNQAIVLDYLEDEDILLYSKCLSARYHIDLSISANYPNIERKYFQQFQHSYNVLLDRYFNKIKMHFSPFSFMQINRPIKADNLKVRVRGSLDINNSRVSYEYIPIIGEKEIEPEIEQSTPGTIGAFIQTGNNQPTPLIAFSDGLHFYKDLELVRLGLDSAREVALSDISDQFKALIEKQLLIPIPTIICEQVVSEIRKVASKAESWQDKSLEPIWKFRWGIYDAQQYLQTFERIQDHPFVKVGTQQSSRVLPLNFGYIIHTLKYIISESISIQNTILPIPNMSGQSPECPAPATIYDFFTPDQIKKRLVRMYSLLPKLYWEFVDKNLCNLPQYLVHCRIYPFKYVIYFREDHDRMYRCYSLSRVYILPVSSESEMTADVIQEEGERIKWTREDFDCAHEEYIKRLKAFDRYTEANKNKFSISNSVIDGVISERPLTNAIYDLLKGDIEYLWRK
jgi:hypothetical protein